MPPITTQLSAFASTLTLPSLPQTLPHRVRLLLLDLIGNIIRARHDAESTPSFLRTVQSLGLTVGTSKVFGDDHAYSPPAPHSSTAPSPTPWISTIPTPPPVSTPERPSSPPSWPRAR
jgi:hypothetical protein